ncbi:MAG: hypothetical protein ACW99G_00465 [Candidatus Thorarchaeota archaeon]
MLEIKHYSKDGEILWQDENILNLLHTEGEVYILTTLFDGEAIPVAYYLGLDNRSSLSVDDTMASLATEPNGNGYLRQPVLSSGEFTFSVTNGGFTQAQTPIVEFNASGGSWGPVSNIFLATQADSTGFLISSLTLSSPVTLSDGERVTVRMGIGMRDCN